MKAIDMEFTLRCESFHPECVHSMRQMRTQFLLVSLLYRLHGHPINPNSGMAKATGPTAWSEMPKALAYVCADAPPSTARDVISIQDRICGECFTLWIRNIQGQWQDCVNWIFMGIAAKDIDEVQHAVNCLLKHDP